MLCCVLGMSALLIESFLGLTRSKLHEFSEDTHIKKALLRSLTKVGEPFRACLRKYPQTKLGFLVTSPVPGRLRTWRHSLLCRLLAQKRMTNLSLSRLTIN